MSELARQSAELLECVNCAAVALSQTGASATVHDAANELLLAALTIQRKRLERSHSYQFAANDRPVHDVADDPPNSVRVAQAR